MNQQCGKEILEATIRDIKYGLTSAQTHGIFLVLYLKKSLSQQYNTISRQETKCTLVSGITKWGKVSYCRFGEADVYIYDDTHFGLICCMCSIAPTKEVETNFLLTGDLYTVHENFVAGEDYDEMIKHIRKHRINKHYVPIEVDQRLIEDRDKIVSKEERA